MARTLLFACLCAMVSCEPSFVDDIATFSTEKNGEAPTAAKPQASASAEPTPAPTAPEPQAEKQRSVKLTGDQIDMLKTDIQKAKTDEIAEIAEIHADVAKHRREIAEIDGLQQKIAEVAELQQKIAEIDADVATWSGDFKAKECTKGANGQVCHNGDAKGTTGNCGCKCNDGYDGPNCETAKECTEGANGQVCRNGDAKGTTGNCGCNCNDGYEGPNCETPSVSNTCYFANDGVCDEGHDKPCHKGTDCTDCGTCQATSVDEKSALDMASPHKCLSNTGGTCRIFGCSRGPGGYCDTVTHRCYCKHGFCARPNAEEGSLMCEPSMVESDATTDIAENVAAASATDGSMLNPILLGFTFGVVTTASVVFAWARSTRHSEEEQGPYIRM